MVATSPRVTEQRRALDDVFGARGRPASANRTGVPSAILAGVEHMSGLDLGDVRVHYGSALPARIRAHSFAHGSEIHVSPGRERDVPHELWHVVQQRQGRVKPTMRFGGLAVNTDRRFELEADEMGGRARRIGGALLEGRFVGRPRIAAPRAPRIHAPPVVQGAWWQWVGDQQPLVKWKWPVSLMVGYVPRLDEYGRQVTHDGLGVWQTHAQAARQQAERAVRRAPEAINQHVHDGIARLEQRYEEDRQNKETLLKIVGTVAAVSTILLIGSSFVVLALPNLPTWVSPLSKALSAVAVGTRLFKMKKDAQEARATGRSTFKPNAKNTAYLTISLVQGGVELAMSHGEYVLLTAGWHEELYRVLKTLFSYCRGQERQPLLDPPDLEDADAV